MDEILAELTAIQMRVARSTPTAFRRFLHGSINWNAPLITITGGRGTGKSTLVMQHFLQEEKDPSRCLYISADNPLALKEGLYALGTAFFKLGGERLLVDEVHKQTEWSVQIKALFDAFPGRRGVLLGSSRLELLSQKGDLSRRTLIYELKPMSFREFLNLKHGLELPSFSMEEVLSDHVRIASSLAEMPVRPVADFEEYLQRGCLPIFPLYSGDEYQQILSNLMDKVIYEDVPSLRDVRNASSVALKKLLAFLAMSKIPSLVVSSLCGEIGVTRETLYILLDLLERADLINIVRPEKKGVRAARGTRILFAHPNMYFCVAGELWRHSAERGNIRESFFASQMKGLYEFHSSETVDYTVRLPSGRTIGVEIGGPGKGKKQLRKEDDGFVFRDRTEVGFGNIVPLWMAGFLY